MSIIPTTTGAAKAIGTVIPELNGKIDGMALRVPVSDGSIADMVLTLKKEVNREEINKVLRDASETELKGIMEYTEEPIVSTTPSSQVRAWVARRWPNVRAWVVSNYFKPRGRKIIKHRRLNGKAYYVQYIADVSRDEYLPTLQHMIGSMEIKTLPTRPPPGIG